MKQIDKISIDLFYAWKPLESLSTRTIREKRERENKLPLKYPMCGGPAQENRLFGGDISLSITRVRQAFGSVVFGTEETWEKTLLSFYAF
jgi:hypothetical protein